MLKTVKIFHPSRPRRDHCGVSRDSASYVRLQRNISRRRVQFWALWGLFELGREELFGKVPDVTAPAAPRARFFSDIERRAIVPGQPLSGYLAQYLAQLDATHWRIARQRFCFEPLLKHTRWYTGHRPGMPSGTRKCRIPLHCGRVLAAEHNNLKHSWPWLWSDYHGMYAARITNCGCFVVHIVEVAGRRRTS